MLYRRSSSSLAVWKTRALKRSIQSVTFCISQNGADITFAPCCFRLISVGFPTNMLPHLWNVILSQTSRVPIRIPWELPLREGFVEKQHIEVLSNTLLLTCIIARALYLVSGYRRGQLLTRAFTAAQVTASNVSLYVMWSNDCNPTGNYERGNRFSF